MNCLGSSKANRKYSNEDVLKIRELYKAGTKQSDLSKKYNIPKSTIHHILNNKYLDERIEKNLI